MNAMRDAMLAEMKALRERQAADEAAKKAAEDKVKELNEELARLVSGLRYPFPLLLSAHSRPVLRCFRRRAARRIRSCRRASGCGRCWRPTRTKSTR